MSFYVRLEDYTPPARDDGGAWTQARIEEAAGYAGPYTVIDTVTLDPLDQDPSQPQTRTLETGNGTLAIAWYRVTWLDDADSEQPTAPTFDNPYRPTVEEIGSLLRARTRTTEGRELGTFTSATRPTGDDVAELIDSASDAVMLDLPDVLPQRLGAYVQRLIALRAAMLVELSYAPDRTDAGSAYANLRQLYLDALAALQTKIDDGTVPDPGGGTTGPNGFASVPIRPSNYEASWATWWPTP